MQKLPMIRSLRAAVMLSLLMLLPVFLFAAEPLMAVYGVALCFLLAPALLSMTALWGGLLPAIVGWAGAVLMAWLPFGRDAGLLMILFLLPGAVAFLVCVSREIPFFQTALILAAAEMAGGFAVLAILNQRTGGQLAATLADQYAQMIVDSGMQDELLMAMLQSGLARLDPSLYSQAQGVFGGLTALGREELLLSMKATLTDILSQLPALLISQSIWHSLVGPGIGIYFGRRAVIQTIVDRRRRELMNQVIAQRRAQLERGEAPGPVRLEGREQMMRELSGDCEQALEGFPTLRMPPFSKWHMPRRIGLMAALPALGYLVALLSDSPQATLVGNMLGGIFSSLYAIQGMAALDFVLCRGSRSLGMRCAILGVATLLFNRIFLLIGVADQVFNFRGLRPPLGGETADSGK